MVSCPEDCAMVSQNCSDCGSLVPLDCFSYASAFRLLNDPISSLHTFSCVNFDSTKRLLFHVQNNY